MVDGSSKHDEEGCGIAMLTRPVRPERPAPAVDPRAISLDRDDALVFLIDFQERLATAMDPETMARVTKNISTLLRVAARLSMPIIASEQYRKGLGPTVASVAALLPAPPLEKLEFSAGNNEALARAVMETGRRQIIVVGMESHVCVFQTVRDLARGGLTPFVPEDAVISRTEANRLTGLRLCEKAGATLTGTESVIFDLLGRAGTPEFKELAPLLK